MPKVSICIPTYQRKQFIKETIDSALAQTYKDSEVIVLDDGSTDGTREFIESLGYNIRYYWFDNMGQSAARNKIIDLAEGQYITFIDSDDILFPDAVEKLVQVIDVHGPDVFVYSQYLGMDEQGNEKKKRNQKLPSGNITADLFEFIYVQTCGTMCSKRIYQEAGGFDTTIKRCAAYKLQLQLSLKYPFIPLQYPTFKKRRHKGNPDRTYDKCRYELEMLEDFYFNGPGKDIVPEKKAMKRLSKESYRLGRCALREGMNERACELLSQSFKRYPNFKSLMHLARAKFKSM